MRFPKNAISGAVSVANNPNTKWPADLVFTLPFLAVYWINLAHHTLFFNELNAWGISAASPTLHQLFEQVHYEGHPWLWYFLLWFPSRFTHNPRAMLWIVAPIGTAIYLAIGLLSPFTRIQKTLIFLSYFVAFEYTVMNRMYCVMFLAALLYAVRRTRKPDGVMGNVALLGVMANTDMTGLLLSAALLLEYLHDRWRATQDPGASSHVRRTLILAVGLYVSLLLVSVLSLLPSPHISWSASSRPFAYVKYPGRLIRVVGNMIAAPWWPISPHFPRHFWDTDTKVQTKLFFLVPFVLLAYWATLRRDKNLLAMMGLCLIFGILFADIVFIGRVYHWGIAFVTFLVCLWIQSYRRPPAQRGHAWHFSAYALMGLSAISGIVTVISSWTHPFSQAKATAGWIRQNQPKDVLLTGAPDYSFASVAEELARPVYFMECNCYKTFKQFSVEQESIPIEDSIARLSQTMGRLRVPSLVFVFLRPIRANEFEMLKAEGLSASLLSEFTGAECEFEDHYVYRISRSDPAKPAVQTQAP